MAKELARQAVKSAAMERSNAVSTHVKKAAKKHAAKKHAAKKHAAKKHAAKKHAVKKHAAKKHVKKAAKQELHVEHAQQYDSPDGEDLHRAFHHLQRASAIISLIEQHSGGDLKDLLHHGVQLYRGATRGRKRPTQARAAAGLLQTAECLAMAGLYAARGVHQSNIDPPMASATHRLVQIVGTRLTRVYPADEYGKRLHGTACDLLKRCHAAGDDPHLAWELAVAAEGICIALEEGID